MAATIRISTAITSIVVNGDVVVAAAAAAAAANVALIVIWGRCERHCTTRVIDNTAAVHGHAIILCVDSSIVHSFPFFFLLLLG